MLLNCTNDFFLLLMLNNSSGKVRTKVYFKQCEETFENAAPMCSIPNKYFICDIYTVLESVGRLEESLKVPIPKQAIENTKHL